MPSWQPDPGAKISGVKDISYYESRQPKAFVYMGKCNCGEPVLARAKKTQRQALRDLERYTREHQRACGNKK